MPVPVLAQCPAYERTHEGAQVDAHVENGEACVATGAAFGVKIAHHGADIGFQQTGTYGNEYQAEEKGRIARYGHAEMSGGNDAAAHEYRLSLPPDVIGYPASGQGQKINRGGVQTVNGR